MKDGAPFRMFLGFARVEPHTGLLSSGSERLAHTIKRLADQRRGLFLAEPQVGARRLPGAGTRLPLAAARLAVIIQGTR